MKKIFSLISDLSEKFFIFFDFVDEKMLNEPDKYISEGSFEFIQLLKSRNERVNFGLNSKNLNQIFDDFTIFDSKIGQELGPNVPSYFTACCLTNK